MTAREEEHAQALTVMQPAARRSAVRPRMWYASQREYVSVEEGIS